MSQSRIPSDSFPWLRHRTLRQVPAVDITMPVVGVPHQPFTQAEIDAFVRRFINARRDPPPPDEPEAA